MNADKLVNRTTAFKTWAAMQRELERGYVPTIKLQSQAGRPLKRNIELDRLVRESGFRTWNGMN